MPEKVYNKGLKISTILGNHVLGTTFNKMSPRDVFEGRCRYSIFWTLLPCPRTLFVVMEVKNNWGHLFQKGAVSKLLTKILHLNNFLKPLVPEHYWSIIPVEKEMKSNCDSVLQTWWSVSTLLAEIEPPYPRALTKYFGCEDWGEDQLRPRWSAPQILTNNVKPKFSRRRTNWWRLIDFYNCSLNVFVL